MYTIIIPSRYGSKRLPGKALLDINGVPMITRCWQAATKSKADRVIVATDDKRIQEAVPDAETVLCDIKYRTGSDRCAAVARDLNIEGTIVNLQGDSPFMPPEYMDLVAQRAQATNCDLATLHEMQEPFKGLENINNDFVPVTEGDIWLVQHDYRVIWCSRARMAGAHRKLGIYAWREGALQDFFNHKKTPYYEWKEGLEQLRAIIMGMDFTSLGVDWYPGSINTPEDYEQCTKK